MQTFGMILFILMAIVFVGSLALSYKKSIDLVKDKRQTINFKNEYFKKLLIYNLIASISFPVMMLSIYLWNATNCDWSWLVKVPIGGLVFGGCLSFGVDSFIIHYYKKGLPEKIDKKLFITLMCSVSLCFISLLTVADGFADFVGKDASGHWNLLSNGLNFQVGFVSPDGSSKPNITFYALCILSGAIFVYFLSDHKLYMKYGKHGLIESTFLLAFPAGIVGARIAYVIGNWEIEFAHRDFWHVFAIWEGGLTILGGAIAGIVVGVLWYKHVNKDKSIFEAVDIIVPTILIAQAVGRWGNFFNCEVHGVQSSESYWWWLPRIVFNNAHYSSANKWADAGNIWVPLFLIEAMVNMLGYFVLAHLFGDLLRKYTKPGDLAFGYIAWYGMTRVVMEPLRDGSFNMGSNGYWSWFWSLIFVLVGLLLIAINHVVRNVLANKKGELLYEDKQFKFNAIFGGIVLAIALAGTIIGIYLMASNSFSSKIIFDNFNIGVILLVTFGSLLLCCSIPASTVIIMKKAGAK